jgi:DNA-binding NarL/FixJ family response regulator
VPPNRTDQIRVVIADDHFIVRDGLRRMLAGTPVVVEAEAATGDQAVELVRKLAPDIVLLDIRMPGMDGFTALREIKRFSPQTPVLMLTAYDDPSWLVQAVASGAAGYLLKSLSQDALVTSIRAVADGDSLIAPAQLRLLIQQLGHEALDTTAAIVGDISKLTARESEVLALIAEGLTNQQIAHMLSVAPSTIKTHVENVMIKLGASDRTQAAVMAVKAGVAR